MAKKFKPSKGEQWGPGVKGVRRATGNMSLARNAMHKAAKQRTKAEKISVKSTKVRRGVGPGASVPGYTRTGNGVLASAPRDGKQPLTGKAVGMPSKTVATPFSESAVSDLWKRAGSVKSPSLRGNINTPPHIGSPQNTPSWSVREELKRRFTRRTPSGFRH